VCALSLCVRRPGQPHFFVLAFQHYSADVVGPPSLFLNADWGERMVRSRWKKENNNNNNNNNNNANGKKCDGEFEQIARDPVNGNSMV